MDPNEFQNLGEGDIIRHKHGAEAMTVVEKVGTTLVLIRTQTATNPYEWDLMYKANHRKGEKG